MWFTVCVCMFCKALRHVNILYGIQKENITHKLVCVHRHTNQMFNCARKGRWPILVCVHVCEYFDAVSLSHGSADISNRIGLKPTNKRYAPRPMRTHFVCASVYTSNYCGKIHTHICMCVHFKRTQHLTH